MSTVGHVLAQEYWRNDEIAMTLVHARYDKLPPRQLAIVFQNVLAALESKSVDIQALLDGTLDLKQLRTYLR